MTVSVVIIAINEQDWIENCILSAKQVADPDSIGAGEIVVVVDDRTTDKTAEIARKMGAKVFSNKFTGFSEMKNLAFSKATSDWIFSLDADERISKELARQVKEVVGDSKNMLVAFSIPRQNILLGEKVRFGGWWPDPVIRLAKKDQITGWKGDLHEVLKVKGTIGDLSGVLYHLSHRGIDWMLETSVKYTQTEAELRFKANHPPVVWWRFLRVIFTEFWFRLVVKSGWRDGTVGWIEAISQAFNMFLVYTRLWEMQKGKSMDTIYKDLDKEMVKNGF